MRYPFIIFILIVGTEIFLPSCKQTPNCIDIQTSDTVFVSDSFIKLFKPSGFDTLTFVSDNNDTNVFIGTGFKDKFFAQWTNFTYLGECRDNHGVFMQHHFVEYKSIFKDNNLIIDFNAPYNNNKNDNINIESNNFNYLFSGRALGSKDLSHTPQDSISLKSNYVYGYHFDFDNIILFNLHYGVLRYQDKNYIIWKRIN